MPLPSQWSTPDDFAALFKYFWHRDFPTNNVSVGARRVDWTIHIGLIVRSIGDLMGLATRFERGGRKDAVLRSREGDEIAIEWEWNDVYGNELAKLKKHKPWSPPEIQAKSLRFAVFVSYAKSSDFEASREFVGKLWEGADWPLLLILVTYDFTKKFRTRRDFKDLNLFVYGPNGTRDLGSIPAAPWNLEATRWPIQLG
jgi:hypothetical protein